MECTAQERGEHHYAMAWQLGVECLRRRSSGRSMGRLAPSRDSACRKTYKTNNCERNGLAFYAVPPNSELIAEKRLTKTQPRAELVGKAAEQAAKVTGASARSATNRARLFPLLSGSKPCYIYAVEVCSQLSSAWVFMSERSPSVAIGSTFADHRTLHDRGVHRGLMQGIATADREVPHPL